ncbi:MAG TPA: high frequency lysogenization protein HflD [Gammaproteobacteria bacterium]
MGYYTLLLFGCLVGMQHALEADHLTAVAAMSTGRVSRRSLVLRGGFWGLGHTITLLAICGVLLVVGETIPPRAEAVLEGAVGIMLILLGASVLRSLWKRRPHFHVHEHGAGVRHIHWHAHGGEVPHSQSAHRHEHAELGLGRALTVGMVHGAAGSAGLLVLAAAADSVLNAIGYVLAFGAGSILGMAALSFVASFPLRFMERSAGWFNTAAVACIGCVAVVIGGGLLAESWSVALS